MVADKLIAVGSLGVVAAVIASLSDQASEFARGLYSGASQMDFAMVRGATVRVPEVLTTAIAFYGTDYTMLAFLGLGAIVFLGLMFRT